MSDSPWLIEHVVPLESLSSEVEDTTVSRAMRGVFDAPLIAVSLRELTIHDNQKWFGEADIRLDALVVHGHGAIGEPDSFYSPGTFRFGMIDDEDSLPIGERLLFFLGEPLYFLDLFLTVSRSRDDADDLSAYLAESADDPSLLGAFGDLASLVAAPQLTAVTAALSAAARIGTFAYQVLRRVTGDTVGLFHTSWLERQDAFGLGRHPEQGAFRVKDLSFAYEISSEGST